MNKAILVGNLTKDPDIRTTGNGTSVASFSVAVQRRMKGADGQYQSDFINCVAWRKTADFVAKYFVKGSKIGLTGTIQTRTYDDTNGVRRYVTEVVVEEVEFVQKKEQDKNAKSDFVDADFQPLDDLDDAKLPF